MACSTILRRVHFSVPSIVGVILASTSLSPTVQAQASQGKGTSEGDKKHARADYATIAPCLPLDIQKRIAEAEPVGGAAKPDQNQQATPDIGQLSDGIVLVDENLVRLTQLVQSLGRVKPEDLTPQQRQELEQYPSEIAAYNRLSIIIKAARAEYDAWQLSSNDYAAKRSKTNYSDALTDALLLAKDHVSSAKELLLVQEAEITKHNTNVAAEKSEGEKVCPAQASYKRYHTLAQNIVSPASGSAMAVLDPSVLAQDTGSATAPSAVAAPDYPGPDPKKDCIKAIESPYARADFSACLEFPGRVFANHLAVPGRALVPRGLTASFSGSASTTETEIKFANEYKLRSPKSDGGQRYSTWGFSIGLATAAADLLDLGGDRKRDDIKFDDFSDRINAATKLTGSLSFNFFPVEEGAKWKKRAAKVRADVGSKCSVDRVKNASLKSCIGHDLYDWVNEKKEDGTLKHASEWNQYSDLYFGPGMVGESDTPQKYPVFGFSLNGEIAQPSFEFERRDPNDATMKLPTDSERKTDWSIGATGYWRPLKSKWKGWDLAAVASLTYKKDWRDYLASDDAFDTSQPPQLVEGFVPAIEGRFVRDGYGRLPTIGVFPKLTFNLASDRNTFDMPVLFPIGEKRDSAIGLKYTHGWGGQFDDGAEFDRPKTHTVSLLFQKTFSVTPE